MPILGLVAVIIDLGLILMDQAVARSTTSGAAVEVHRNSQEDCHDCMLSGQMGH